MCFRPPTRLFAQPDSADRLQLSDTLESIQDLDGVGPVTANKLKEAGFDSVEAIAVAPIRELVDKAGLESSVAIKIVRAARQTIHVDLLTAKQLYDKRQSLLRLSTSSENLNGLLGGGLETQAMTEFIGEYGTGKTQLCMTFCVTAQLPTQQGGFDAKVLFLDSEGTFAPQRIYQIAEGMSLDANKILEGIYIARTYNSDHQVLTVDHAFKLCKEENIKLIIVDSVLSHFRSEYIGRENLSERQQRLNSHLHKLARIAQTLNLAVVLTNQVQANPQAFFGDPTRPAGGHILAHASTHRVMLKKSSNGLRCARIIDSPCLPESETYFSITEKGIQDAQPKARRGE
jgi:DNA repair protein RadA